MQQPKIGRMVHYRITDGDGKEYCVPALITGTKESVADTMFSQRDGFVLSLDDIHLTYFDCDPDEDEQAARIWRAENGTDQEEWHWPEACPQGDV